MYTDAMVGAWLESGNDFYLEAIGEPYRLLEADEDEKPKFHYTNDFKNTQSYKATTDQFKQGKKQYEDFMAGKSYDGKGKNVVDGKTIKPDDPNFLVRIKRFLTDKPREYLARAVARLRQTYNNFLLKADKEKEEGKIKWYKTIARKILQAIDWVLRKIQSAATIDYGKRIKNAKEGYYDKIDNAKRKWNEDPKNANKAKFGAFNSDK